jgi:hypothetical protein
MFLGQSFTVILTGIVQPSLKLLVSFALMGGRNPLGVVGEGFGDKLVYGA